MGSVQKSSLSVDMDLDLSFCKSLEISQSFLSN
jgi:hypothetical protein